MTWRWTCHHFIFAQLESGQPCISLQHWATRLLLLYEVDNEAGLGALRHAGTCSLTCHTLTTSVVEKSAT